MRIGLSSRLNGVRRRQKGSVAIEFAIVGGLLIMVLGAIIETGIFLMIQFNLQSASETASRRIRTNQVQSTALLDDFKTEICAKIAINDCHNKVFVDVRNGEDVASLAAKMPFETNQTPKVGPDHAEIFDPGGAGQWGSLIVTYDWDFSFPFMDAIFGNLPNGNRRLFGLSVFKNET